MPSALTVKEPKIDHSTTENSSSVMATSPIQPMGVVIGSNVSSFSGERSLSRAALLKILLLSSI